MGSIKLQLKCYIGDIKFLFSVVLSGKAKEDQVMDAHFLLQRSPVLGIVACNLPLHYLILFSLVTRLEPLRFILFAGSHKNFVSFEYRLPDALFRRYLLSEQIHELHLIVISIKLANATTYSTSSYFR